MKPINDEWLQFRLQSSSKSRLKRFRSSLAHDEDRRNYDYDLAQTVERYLLPYQVDYYKGVKHYLRDLKSSTNGKFFSQGVKEYSKMMEAIERFQMPDHTTFRWNENYQSAKEFLMKQFQEFKINMVVYHDDESMISKLPKLNTHSGYTYILTGRKRKGDNLDNIYSRYTNEELLAKEKGSFNKPILPGCRTQSSGAFDDNEERTGDCKHKTRLISMIDMMVIFAELKFSYPLQQAMKFYDSYAGGKSNREISSIISNDRYNYNYFISLDYSSFDQSISKWLIYDAFDIIQSAFIGEFDEELYNVIKNDFIYKNFIMADGVYFAEKGVPSGSMFTQIVDSVVNLLMVHTYLNSIKNQGHMIVMGDDNLLYTMDRVEPSLIKSYIEKNFGIEINEDKTSFGLKSDDPEFLSRYWRNNGEYRSIPVVISKMLYPERKRYYNKQITPEIVLYSYILTYPLTMNMIINVDEFYANNRSVSREFVEKQVDSRYLPGAMRFIIEYTGAG